MDDLDQVFESVAAYFSLLSEPMRLKILHAICNQERSVNDIVDAVEATQTNVSRHLNQLYRAGVVARRKEGNSVYYRVSDPSFVEICRTACVQIAGRIDDHQPLREDLLDLMPATSPRTRQRRPAGKAGAPPRKRRSA
jgi:DNA-binding transcriptional ArsR family regulator